MRKSNYFRQHLTFKARASTSKNLFFLRSLQPRLVGSEKCAGKKSNRSDFLYKTKWVTLLMHANYCVVKPACST